MQRTGWMASAPLLTAADSRLGMLRYDSVLAGSPMQTASSAICARTKVKQCVLEGVTKLQSRQLYLNMQAICICQGVDGHCLQPQLFARTYHSDGYLSPVRNENLCKARE